MFEDCAGSVVIINGWAYADPKLILKTKRIETKNSLFTVTRSCYDNLNNLLLLCMYHN